MEGLWRATPAEPASVIYKAQFCLSVCFNFSETSWDTSFKLATIDHHPVLSVIRVFMTSWWRHNQNIFLKFASLVRGPSLFAQTKTSFRLTTLQKPLFVWGLKCYNQRFHNLRTSGVTFYSSENVVSSVKRGNFITTTLLEGTNNPLKA